MWRIYLVAIALLFVNGKILGQYNKTNNQRIVLAESSAHSKVESANMVAENFFNYARNNQFDSWQELLSEKCFLNKKLAEEPQKWWKVLKNIKKPVALEEAASVKRNQKLYYYKTGTQQNPLVLVQEKGNWKVFYIEL